MKGAELEIIPLAGEYRVVAWYADGSCDSSNQPTIAAAIVHLAPLIDAAVTELADAE